MKFPLRPAATWVLLTLTAGLAACATAANRRVQYYPTQPHGPWHDYRQRQVVAAQIGVPASALPTPAAPLGVPGAGTVGVPGTAVLPIIAPPAQVNLPPPSVTTELPAPAPPPPSIAQ